MKKEIIIYECDFCGIDLIKRHDSIYYFIEHDSPGWASFSYSDDDGVRKILCERCYKKTFTMKK